MGLIGWLLSIFGIWRKSRFSNGNGGNNCVEVAMNIPLFVGIRDSKDPTGGALIVNRTMWRELVRGARDGEFDLAA